MGLTQGLLLERDDPDFRNRLDRIDEGISSSQYQFNRWERGTCPMMESADKACLRGVAPIRRASVDNPKFAPVRCGSTSREGRRSMPTQTCKFCICNTLTPGVTINTDGRCSKCEEYEAHPRYNLQAFKAKLEQGFDEVRAQPVTYHALAMFSGGKDSSYLVYLLKKRYNLRPLAFAVVHPFVNELSIRNMDRVARRLEVDLIKFYIDESVVKRYMRYSILNGPAYGLGEMFGCTTCSNIYHKIALMMAIRMRIPFVADGTDPTQSAISLPILIEGARLKKFYLSDSKPPVDRLFEDALDASHRGSIYDFNPEQFKDEDFPTKVSPFSFIGYDHEHNVRELVREGILTEEQANPEATNCDLMHLFSYIAFRRFNSHPYTLHISQGLRKDVPTLVDQFFVEGDERLNRDEHLTVLNEYKNLLFSIADHPEFDTAELHRLATQLPTIAKHMRAKHLKRFIERVAKMHVWAAYFDIELNAIAPASA
jgi:hypothetical protein